jgi:putative selenium metabolism hydrolase
LLTDIRNDKLIDLCKNLIKIKSYSGEEKEVVDYLYSAFKEMGYDDVSIDKYGNILGRIKGNKPGKAVLFDGHVDTVPVSDPLKWHHDPFGGEIIDGKMYGRGTTDMKCALGAMVCAAAFFAEDTKRNFAGDIYVAGVVHEECFEGIASGEISRKVKPDYVVIGEASELNLKIGQRGRAEIVVETIGKPAHSANPDKGINAVYKMCKLIGGIREIDVTHHDFLGKGIMELTDIKSDPYPGASVVPENCKATYDRRLLVGETRESVLQPILDVISKMEKEDPDFKAKAYFSKGKEKCYTGDTIEGERFFPGWLFGEKEEFVQDVYNGLKDAGLNPEITNYSFCTNGSRYAGEEGIRTVGFGPSLESLAHVIDEYIEIDQLLKVCTGYYSIIGSLLK